MKYAIILFAFLISPTAFAQNACNATKTHIVTEHKEHDKYVFFFKQNRKKHIHTEKAVDGNGKVLIKTTCEVFVHTMPAMAALLKGLY